ncbi:MAG: VWA domain-containing protein [Candidatus Nealsonbacteria bacterium]|nr:VWA domain-containing protein [Candidatus Nealsonbacteria bacterium]
MSPEDERLSQVIDFRVGRGAKGKYPIERRPLIPAPSTDGKKIFIPTPFPFSQEMLIDTIRHEADHIKEMEDLSRKISNNPATDAAKEYIEKFFWRKEVEENPTLAFEILNIVWDNSIDAAAIKELAGSKRIFEKEKPGILAKRPSTARFNDLDKFRELFLQKTLLGQTKEVVPEKWQTLLEECVNYAKNAQGKDIPAYLETTQSIYQKFKENFDIKQKLQRLPPLHGRGKPVEGFQIPQNYREEENSNQGNGKKTSKKPKEKESKEKTNETQEKNKPREKSEGRKEPKDKRGEQKETPWLNEDRDILNPALLELEGRGKVGEIIGKHSGEIERMIKIFRHLKQEAMLPKRKRDGQELELDEYIQSELKKEATGVDSQEPMFLNEIKKKPNPAWAILQDISGSTSGIIEELKAASIILGETMKRSNYHFGLYAFNSDASGKDYLYPLKDFEEKYSLDSLKKILNLQSDGGTGMADAIKYLTEKLLKLPGFPRGLIVVTDGMPNRLAPVERVIKEAASRGVIVIFVCVGQHLPEISKIVKEYISIKNEEIHKLPQEMLAIFRKYRLAR